MVLHINDKKDGQLDSAEERWVKAESATVWMLQ